MKNILALVGALLALSSFTFGQTKDSNGPDAKAVQELRDLVRTWDEAEAKRDTATLDRLLADEFAFVGGPTKSQYLAYIKSAPSDSFIESALSEGVEVQVYENTAIVTGLDVVRGKNKGERYVSRWMYMDVWIRRAGRWQCVKTYSNQMNKHE